MYIIWSCATFLVNIVELYLIKSFYQIHIVLSRISVSSYIRQITRQDYDYYRIVLGNIPVYHRRMQILFIFFHNNQPLNGYRHVGLSILSAISVWKLQNTVESMKKSQQKYRLIPTTTYTYICNIHMYTYNNTCVKKTLI